MAEFRVNDIRRALKELGGSASLSELADNLGIGKKDHQKLRGFLRGMVREGLFVQNRDKSWAPSSAETGNNRKRPAPDEHEESHAPLPVPQGETKDIRLVGTVVRKGNGQFILRPHHKTIVEDVSLHDGIRGAAADGDLIVCHATITGKSGRPILKDEARIIGRADDPKAISLISLFESGLKTEFSAAAQGEAEGLSVPSAEGREDLRHLPLVTIDGPNARDFDDAVYAEKTKNGFHLIVAIADVSYYVRPGSALDAEAQERGNSTYFPDRVLPMLPESLSNGLCSLKPGEDRACMVTHIHIDKKGNITDFSMNRGLMRSAARLTYDQVQDAREGRPDDVMRPLIEKTVTPLYEAFDALRRAREERGALNLDRPESEVHFTANGELDTVKIREHRDSHRLIEEFMIASNVVTAKTLEKTGSLCVYRVHDQPDEEKMSGALQLISELGLKAPEGEITSPKQLNDILKQAADQPFSHLVSHTLLKAQKQARYSTNNRGHFGLALESYAHETSPIRRYADLMVHRFLVHALKLGPGGVDPAEQEAGDIEKTAVHISKTERDSDRAEQRAEDRFMAAYLLRHKNKEFSGMITGVTDKGLFVELKDSGAEGFIPLRLLPPGPYKFDQDRHLLSHEDKKKSLSFRMGSPLAVTVVEADPLRGRILFAPMMGPAAKPEPKPAFS